MDSGTTEYPLAPPNSSINEMDPENLDNNISPIPNPITPDFLIRPDRRQVVYNAEERKVLDTHKEQYLASKSAEEHKNVAKTYILPAIFQYWDSIGRDIGDSRTQTQKLAAWMQNTWRGTKVAETVIAGAAMKRTEVLWQTRNNDVFAEIARLMGLDSASTQTPNWFAFRMKALGNMLQHMSALELEQLDRQGEAIVFAANHDNDRKQLLAEKNAISRFSKSAKGHWYEMGVLSLSFVTYTDSSGKLVVQVHDQMAELMEVDAPLFESQYRPQVHQMKLYLMEYITKMKKILNPGPQPWAPGGTGSDVRDLSLQFDRGGFPILPLGLDTKSGNLPVKKELDEMIRKYFAQHYKLATCGKTKHVPYKQLQENQARFILPEYLPHGFEMKDPRDVALPNLMLLIDHILKRQQTHPISHVFRFSMVNAKRKGYEPIRTHYPDESENEDSEPEDAPDPDSDPDPGPPLTGKHSKKQRQRKARKERKINGQNVFRLGDNLLQISPDPDSDPEPSTHISRSIDKGKGKAIGPDPAVQVSVVQDVLESLDGPSAHHELPQFYSDNGSHGGHVDLHPWGWGSNSGSYPDATQNAGAYPDANYNTGLTMANSYPATSSTNKTTQGPLDTDPNNGLDDMAYIRSFSASQDLLYNTEVHYQFQNAHTEGLLSNANGGSVSLAVPAPWPGPVPTEYLSQLNAGPASTPDFSPTIYDQSITNRTTIQQMPANGSNNVHSPSICVMSHTEPPKTTRKSKNASEVQVHNSMVNQSNLENENQNSASRMGPALSSSSEFPVMDSGNTAGSSLRVIANEGDGPSTGAGTFVGHINATAELIVSPPQSNNTAHTQLPIVDPFRTMGPLLGPNAHAGPGPGPGTFTVPTNSIAMPIVEPVRGSNPKHGGKRVVRTSDTLALLESESDRLQVNGPRKRIRKVRE